MEAVLVAEFTVAGAPVAQGSKSAYVVGGRAVVADANRKVLKPWRAQVAAEAQLGRLVDERVEGPVALDVEFRFVRPKSVRREHPSVKPDADKLLRALMDGITDSGLWRDDAQVVDVHVTKVYADVPGARVRVGELTPNK